MITVSLKYKLIITLFVLPLISCENDEANNTLMDTWGLTGYEDSSSDTRTEPPNGSEQITITFNTSELKGDTGRNKLSAGYTVEGDLIIITNLGGTEINESDWGKLFLSALAQPFDPDTGTIRLEYVLSGNILKIRYGENMWMDFRRL